MNKIILLIALSSTPILVSANQFFPNNSNGFNTPNFNWGNRGNNSNWNMPSMNWGNGNNRFNNGSNWNMPSMNWGNGNNRFNNGSNWNMPSMNWGNNNGYGSGSNWSMPSMNWGSGNNGSNWNMPSMNWGNGWNNNSRPWNFSNNNGYNGSYYGATPNYGYASRPAPTYRAPMPPTMPKLKSQVETTPPPKANISSSKIPSTPMTQKAQSGINTAVDMAKSTVTSVAAPTITKVPTANDMKNIIPATTDKVSTPTNTEIK